MSTCDYHFDSHYSCVIGDCSGLSGDGLSIEMQNTQ